MEGLLLVVVILLLGEVLSESAVKYKQFVLDEHNNYRSMQKAKNIQKLVRIFCVAAYFLYNVKAPITLKIKKSSANAPMRELSSTCFPDQLACLCALSTSRRQF